MLTNAFYAHMRRLWHWPDST